MNLINNNPFRILDLPVTANEREITKQIHKLETYVAMGKTKSYDSDYPFLSPINRTSQTIVDAKKQIEQNESRFLNSLFWFSSDNISDSQVSNLNELNFLNSIYALEKSLEKSLIPVSINDYTPTVFIQNIIESASSLALVANNEDHHLYKSESKFIVDRKNSLGASIPGVYVDLNYNENWSFEVDCEWHDGVDNQGFGIYFGRDKGSFYFFDIAANGYYRFSKKNDWKFSSIITWKYSNVINLKQQNHLAVKKVDGLLYFFINNILVDSAVSEPFFGKTFGFNVTSNQKITFNHFKVSHLRLVNNIIREYHLTHQNCTSFKNLSLLYLWMSFSNGKIEKEYFRKCVHYAKLFITSSTINDYAKNVIAESFLPSQKNVIHFFIKELIYETSDYFDKPNGIPLNEFVRCFSEFPIEANQFLCDQFASKQLRSITAEIETSEKTRVNSPKTASTTGKSLIRKTKSDILYLKSILGKDDFQYQIIADKLAVEVIQCGIDFFNSTNNDIVYQSEYEFALDIAVKQNIIDRAKENLDSCIALKQKLKNQIHINDIDDDILREFLKSNPSINFDSLLSSSDVVLDFNTSPTACWFCCRNESTDNNKYTKTIYKVNSRGYKKVSYSYKEIKINRCDKCESIHLMSNFILFAVFLPIASLGWFIGSLFRDEWWILGLVSGVVVGSLFGDYLKNKYATFKGTKSTCDSSLKENSVISSHLSSGWQLSKPKAY